MRRALAHFAAFAGIGTALHCHILTHAEGDEGMFGMVTALVVQAN
jgi:FtsP/CotA-like multicopper oxidase with cupredoxin domain